MNLALIRILDPKNILNVLLSILPISFIAGNLIINLNLLSIVLFTSIFYGRDLISLKLLLIDKIIIFLFFFTFFVGLTNSFVLYENILNFEENIILKKSLFFFKYLIFYFCIRTLVENNIFNFKFFFVSCSCCVLFVSLDLIYQLIFGKDIFGFERIDNKLPGPFGDEQIAGGYLQRFSFFLFFLFFVLNKKIEKKFFYFLLISLFLLISFAVLISGNRMPFVMYLLSWFFLFLLEKRIRKYFLPFLILSFTFVILIFLNVDQVRNNVTHFYSMLHQMVNFFLQLFENNANLNFPNAYTKELYSGLVTWKINPIFGGGIESFNINCSKLVKTCASHPHNYYLEILSEIGLLGMLIVSIVFLYVLYIAIFKKFIDESLFQNNNYISPFAIMFLIEVFPIKSSGSFFTTGNSTYIFFIIAVILGLYRKQQLN